MNNIYDTLMRQAPMTIEEYMRDCKRILDDEFGDGFAKNNPELLGRMVQACATDYGASCIGQKITELAETLDPHELAQYVGGIAAAIEEK